VKRSMPIIATVVSGLVGCAPSTVRLNRQRRTPVVRLVRAHYQVR
jgi:hypothetical protein